MNKEKLTINLSKLEKELQDKWFPQAEIDKVLMGAKDINNKNFHTFEDVYKSLFKEKAVHVNA